MKPILEDKRITRLRKELRAMRKAAEMSQDVAAARSGLSTGTICNYEMGSSPGMDLVKVLILVETYTPHMRMSSVLAGCGL